MAKNITILDRKGGGRFNITNELKNGNSVYVTGDVTGFRPDGPRHTPNASDLSFRIPVGLLGEGCVLKLYFKGEEVSGPGEVGGFCLLATNPKGESTLITPSQVLPLPNV